MLLIAENSVDKLKLWHLVNLVINWLLIADNRIKKNCGAMKLSTVLSGEAAER